MPVNVVKSPEDERHWARAKSLAAKQGRAKDWQYIMGIFQRMSGKKSVDAGQVSDLKKSLGVTVSPTPRFYMSRWPGQVPNKEALETMRLAQQEPPKFSVARLMQHDGSYLSPDNVVDGIGLDRAKATEWRTHLKKAVASTNELTFRQDIMSKMLHDRMDSASRQALFQRAMSFYRDMRKSMVAVSTPDELRKSETRTEGPDRLYKSLVRKVRHAPPSGLPLAQLDDLVRRYGRRSVAETLEKACRDRGSLCYRNGVLLLR